MEDCEGAETIGVVRGVRPVVKGVRPVPFVTGVRPVPPSIIDSKLSPRSPAEGVSMGTPRSATVELRKEKVPTLRLVGLRGLLGAGAVLKTPTILSSCVSFGSSFITTSSLRGSDGMEILLFVKLLREVTWVGFAVVTIVVTGGGAETIVDGTVVVVMLF